MVTIRRFLLHPSCWGILPIVCVAVGTGCGPQEPSRSTETAYVRGSNVPLRDQLGPDSSVIGTLQSGEQVEILSKRPRWAQIRSSGGPSGWVQQRVLASQEVFDQFRDLASEIEALPSQGKAVMRQGGNLHLEPRRDAEAFYHLEEAEAAEVVAHRAVERAGGTNAPAASPPGAAVELEVRSYEDWLLVRASEGRAGWALESLLDMDVPLEVAQYSEGLRIRAWFVLRVEQDQGAERPWYLWATIRPRRGLPFDYDEIRVFVWNPRNARYETAHRERNLIGFYPIRVEQRETPQGLAPAFSLQLEDERGNRFPKNYVMAGRQVRVER